MNTDFSQINFSKANHIYTYRGKTLTSVTKWLSQFKTPFDSDYWSKRKAQERGVSQDVIFREWDEAGKRGRERGARVHAHIERVLRGQQPEADQFLSLNDELPEIRAFNDFWDRFRPIVAVDQIEWVIGDAGLGIAGTVDVLFRSMGSNSYHLFDWKTGGKFKVDNKLQTMKPPFQDLDDCEFNQYSLQTSLYRLIIERNTNLPMADSYIVHLGSDGCSTIHKAGDYRRVLADYLSK